MKKISRPAIFIDKDGTLVKNIPYNADVTNIRFMPGAVKALRSLQKMRFQLIIVTNQSGIAKGMISEDDIRKVRAHLLSVLKKHGVALNGFFYCPHESGCTCRKPQPGLLLNAARAHRVDLKKSWMLGDILDDVEAGVHAGCKTILVDSGNERDWSISGSRMPHFICRSLTEATKVIRAHHDN